MPVMLWEPSNKLLSKSCGDCGAIRSEAEQCCFVSMQACSVLSVLCGATACFVARAWCLWCFENHQINCWANRAEIVEPFALRRSNVGFVSTQCFQCEICMSGDSFARVCAKGASARPYLEGHEARKNLNLWQAETQEPETTLSYTTVTSKSTSLPQKPVCQSFSIGQMDILDYTWITLERWETGLWDMRMQLNLHILESWGLNNCATLHENRISTFRTAHSTTMR